MISTHILDTSLGHPAAQVKVVLEMMQKNDWIEIASGITNSDGRFTFDNKAESGKYRILFQIEDYLKSSGRESFFLDTHVAFTITDTHRKYHVPLLLNPFGYSTYRGS